MSVLSVILLIVLLAVIIHYCFLFCLFIKSIKMNQEILNGIVKNTQNNTENSEKLSVDTVAFQELSNDYVLLNVAHSILFMLLNLAYNNEEKYSFYFNNLYFFGVPKEYLEDMEKISEFHNNCLNHKYILQEGESPFQYKFILKEKENEENNN